MSTDSSQPLGQGPRPEWDLPEIRDIEIRRVPFEAFGLRNFESSLADHEEAVEFLVRTSGPIPARALGPALLVGDVQVIESEQVEEDRYRFLAFDPDRLQPEASIRWGWTNDPQEQLRETEFRYVEDG
ncbi:MAG: hypothetical protein ACRDTR_05530 [Rubrobacter sp.]